MNTKPVLVTGATGYVGGRLVPRLLNAGYKVRAIGRSLDKLACRPWAAHPDCELVKADVMDLASLARAAAGCGAAYYLVHSMNPRTRDFAAADRRAALNMSAAAEHAGLERMIYLGGLVPDDPDLSHHLRSRAEVGRILQAGAVPTTWLRAAMVMGSGSASFELLRYLCERLPVMVTPRWVKTRCQPICIRNVLNYLVACLGTDEVLGQSYDLGGPEVVTYEELFQIYAQEAGLPRRLIVPVPVLSPRLSSYWIHLVTPVPASLAQPLAEGLRNTVVAHDDRITRILPQRLMGARETIRRALEKTNHQCVETCWTDAGELQPPEWAHCDDAPYAGGTVFETAYRVVLAAEPEEVWRPIHRIGGKTGWYFDNWLWRVRGWMDTLAGGVGLRRGRRNVDEILLGDALDFWRVLEVEPNRRLLLLAEMKVPGQAVLEFRLESAGPGRTALVESARFLPRGLAGLAYWYAVYPLHDHLFLGMMRGIARSIDKPIVAPPARFDPAREAPVCGA